MFCKIYWDLYWDLEGMSDFFQIIYKFLTALCNCGFFLGFLRFFFYIIYIYIWNVKDLPDDSRWFDSICGTGLFMCRIYFAVRVTVVATSDPETIERLIGFN